MDGWKYGCGAQFGVCLHVVITAQKRDVESAKVENDDPGSEGTLKSESILKKNKVNCIRLFLSSYQNEDREFFTGCNNMEVTFSRRLVELGGSQKSETLGEMEGI